MSKLINLKEKDGDGEDDIINSVNISIETVENGWVVNITDTAEEGDEFTQVFEKYKEKLDYSYSKYANPFELQR